MIKYIQFSRPVTVPAQVSVITFYNHTIHGKTCRAELCREGVELHMGKSEGGDWKPTGEIVTVYRGNIDYVTEVRERAPVAGVELRKAGGR